MDLAAWFLKDEPTPTSTGNRYPRGIERLNPVTKKFESVDVKVTADGSVFYGVGFGWVRVSC